MAREFSTSEIIRQKCSICGIKNKIYTDLIYKKKHIGFMLTCCNCGHKDIFMDSELSAKNINYTTGQSVCIQVTTCNNKACEYYGKYSLKTASDYISNLLNGNTIDDGINKNNSTSNNLNNLIENSNSDKLVINGCNFNPRFH